MSKETIYRQDAIDVARKCSVKEVTPAYMLIDKAEIMTELIKLPSAQSTLYGYDIEHLMLIVTILRKEGLPPEKVVEALTNIERIVSIVRAEFEESLREAVEQCKIQ